MVRQILKICLGPDKKCGRQREGRTESQICIRICARRLKLKYDDQSVLMCLLDGVISLSAESNVNDSARVR